MLTCLRGGRIIDPANGGERVGDLFIEGERIVAEPLGRKADQIYDVTGKIVMAGAIDIHSHIAGGNVNTARLLLPEHIAAQRRARPTCRSRARLVDLRDRLRSMPRWASPPSSSRR